jgi:hypothetical protein
LRALAGSRKVRHAGRPRTLERATTLAICALCAAVALRTAIEAQESAPTAAAQSAPTEEIIVLGKQLEELRIRIERAEDDVYSRFNEINGNDAYDIHCYERAGMGSHIQRRTCLSNAWRQMDAAVAEATVRDLQSASGGPAAPQGSQPAGGTPAASHIPQQYRAKQLRTEKLVADELRRLAHEDPELGAAMVRLGQAYQAEELMTGSRADWTLYREVTAGDQGLPFDAQHLFEVRIGATQWSQKLSTRTFTIVGVDGRIRGMRVACDKADRKLEYEDGLDWTIPDGWGACTLSVDAKRGTTFALYEFE